MKKEPLVMCLTNTVAANFTANVLLAIGAKPAMMSEPSEAAELAVMSDAVLVNLGTVDESQAKAIRATLSAVSVKVPWVLDPVAVHLLAFRQKLLRELLEMSLPAAIRGNLAEISFLRQNSSHFLGTVPQNLGTVPQKLPQNLGSVPMLATGREDTIWGAGTAEGEEGLKISGGVEMLTKVTATGCAQGAIVAAMIAKGLSPTEACVSASRMMKRAGELAWTKTHSPGSFQIALIDALHELAEND